MQARDQRRQNPGKKQENSPAARQRDHRPHPARQKSRSGRMSGTNAANQRQSGHSQQRHKPNRKPRPRILSWQQAQHPSGKQDDEQSFRKRIQSTADRYLGDALQRRPHHFAPLRSSISRRRSSSSASMPRSSRMFK